MSDQPEQENSHRIWLWTLIIVVVISAGIVVLALLGPSLGQIYSGYGPSI